MNGYFFEMRLAHYDNLMLQKNIINENQQK